MEPFAGIGISEMREDHSGKNWRYRYLLSCAYQPWSEEDVSEDAKEYLEEKEELVKTAKVPIESERKEELEIEEEVEEEKPQKKTKEQKKIEKEEAKRKKKEEKAAKKKTDGFDW